MTRWVSLIGLVVLIAMPGIAESTVDGFIPRTYTSSVPSREVMGYRLFIPPQYDKSKPYPLIVWLHGAGGAGTDNLRQIREDQIPGTHIWTAPRNQAKYPAFVVVPQSPTNWIASGVDKVSPEMLLVFAILDSVQAEFNIDASRIYVAGQSDGGMGTWNAITQRPNLFAAAIPLCGAGDPALAGRIARLPLWAFHGARDDVIPVGETRRMIAAMQKAGGHPRYTEYPKVGHDIWEGVFKEKDLVDWLFAQHR